MSIIIEWYRVLCYLVWMACHPYTDRSVMWTHLLGKPDLLLSRVLAYKTPAYSYYPTLPGLSAMFMAVFIQFFLNVFPPTIINFEVSLHLINRD